ncbi:MAG: endolytic transglycosylase MltG [Caulobacteraceae bacterium]|nr:endolytic transglycosylase MltG [Caulobacteraceae bacterium]
MSRRPRPRRLTGRGGFAALLLLILIAAAGYGLFVFAGPGPKARSGSATTVIFERGAGTVQIARDLRAAGVIRSKLVFMIMAKATPGSLKAGEYAIASGEPMARILADIKAGRVVRHFVTIPEGWTSAMAADAVNGASALTGTAPTPPEGAVLPDTYEFSRGEDRAKLIQRMETARDKLLAQLWAARRPDLPYKTPQEAVVMASIVEKETGLTAERTRVAAVFVNRLKAGIRLESDPTVIYGVSQGRPLGRGLTASELARETPYNTYRVAGLPPTPIANPGRAALAAALDPAKTDDLYFVATGAGGHVFTPSFAEHQKNVARWRQVERQRAAQAAAGTGR